MKVHEVENTENPLNTSENVVKSDKEIINEQRTDTKSTDNRFRQEAPTDGSNGTRYSTQYGILRSFKRRSETGSGNGILEPVQKFKTELEQLGYPINNYKELATSNEDVASFISNFRASNGFHGKWAAQVYEYSPEEYKQMKLFTAENGKSGFALKTDGDIVSVFSQEKHGSYAAMRLAIESGGYKLDCFDTFLPAHYKKFGFVEVRREKSNEKHKPKDWDKEFFKKYNNGEPDVVYMELKKETQTGTPVKADKPEQLKLDLDFSTVTPKQAAEAVINGKSADVGDIAAMVDNIIKNDKTLSSFKWKDIANNADMKEQLVKMLSDKNISPALSKAYLNGDVKTVADIMCKQLAANKAISLLYDQLQDLGLNATKEQRKAIISFTGVKR